jgi:hypothetical protein
VSVPVQADDVLILATDGLSDNLWDEQVLAEVVRFRRSFLSQGQEHGRAHETQAAVEGKAAGTTTTTRLLGRRAMAGMLSEALCSLARRVSESGHGRGASCASSASAPVGEQEAKEEDEVPFARRAREHGRVFRGGKADGRRYFFFFLVRGRLS